jgi:RNA polymerase sigma factor (sigma-70 family)
MAEIESIIERVLVLRSQTGDRAALEELYLRYARRLDYYLQRLLDRPEEAADVQQEVWLTVIRSIGRLKHAEALRVWLYRIARTRALDHLGDAHQMELAEWVGDEAADESGEGFSPADAAAIHQAIGKLARPHREVLLLRFMEGLSYEDIAQVIGRSVGTVRSRLFYAKRALRPELEKY